MAAIGGHSVARNNLGVLERDVGKDNLGSEACVGNMNRALKHFMIAAGGGNEPSVTNIKELYMNGYATKDDYTKALHAYQSYLDYIKSDQRDKAAAFDEKYKYY